MKKRDFYEVLGLTKGASEKEIKSAYRKQVKKYHPDTNQGNEEAERKFKEVTEAYEVLSDTEKKKLYDRFGMVAFDSSMGNGGQAETGGDRTYSSNFGKSGNFREFHYSSGKMDDLFGDFFGDMFGDNCGTFQRHFGRGESRSDSGDMQTEITISFEEAAFGCEKLLRISGTSEERLQVFIPAGIGEGQSVRLKGKGYSGTHGGKTGDLLIKVHIQEKPGYERKGLDVYTSQNIPFTTAALGGEAYFQTLYGKVSCRIPAGTQSGSKIRLREKGIVSMKDSSMYGDAYVTIGIEVPKHLTQEEKRALEELERTQKTPKDRVRSVR